jgi:hypothetical protein
MYVDFYVKYSLFLLDFNENLISSADFQKIIKYNISWNSTQWEAVFPCGQTDGQTDMTMPIVAFRSFVKAPKK